MGAESTGKSTLAAALGVSLPAVVVPESLRRFVDEHGRVPTRTELDDGATMPDLETSEGTAATLDGLALDDLRTLRDLHDYIDEFRGRLA